MPGMLMERSPSAYPPPSEPSVRNRPHIDSLRVCLSDLSSPRVRRKCGVGIDTDEMKSSSSDGDTKEVERKAHEKLICERIAVHTSSA
jgi:hypothetical protein